MQFCCECGHAISHRVPPGDDRHRYVCDHCGHIHYQNPKLVVGCVPEWQGLILICRRAIEPRRGYWTIPAGFMENGETCAAGAARETREEACAEVRVGAPLALIDVPRIHQVHLMYRATMPDGQHSAGPESLETALIRPEDIPWESLAFPSVHFTLERFMADRAAGREDFHRTAIDYRRPGGTRSG